MSERLHILQHALGLNKYGEGDAYRSHFVTGTGSDDLKDCLAMVAEGLMTEHLGNHYSRDSDKVFWVTPKGMKFVRMNSEKRDNKL